LYKPPPLHRPPQLSKSRSRRTLHFRSLLLSYIDPIQGKNVSKIAVRLIISAHHGNSIPTQHQESLIHFTSLHFTSTQKHRTNMRERSRGSIVSLSKCPLTHVVTTNTNKHISSSLDFVSKDKFYPTTATGLNSLNKFS